MLTSLRHVFTERHSQSSSGNHRPTVERTPRSSLNPIWQRLAMRPPHAQIQPKLTISNPTDMHEQEADRVGQQVIGMPASVPAETGQAGPRVQCSATTTYASGEAPPIVHEALRSPGQPLDSATRNFMEPRFGHDFSRVRIHTDQTAAASAQAINARAYAMRSDVVFGAGEYAPATASGRGLLAHELAHVAAQQPGAGEETVSRQTPGTPVETPQPPQEPLDDPAVRAAIDQVWEASFGHEPFDSTMPELSDLPEAGEAEAGQAPASGSGPVQVRGQPTYREGKYEGVTFREAYFHVDADGKPTAIQVSQYPLDIKGVDTPDGARAYVHSHPDQKRATQDETGGTMVVEGVKFVDEIAAEELKIPVYAVAKNDVLKTYLAGTTLSTARFSRNKLTKEK